MVFHPKKDAPWRRVEQTVSRGGGKFYDVLECGHAETHDVLSKKRRCRTCADPTFLGIDTSLVAPLPPTASQPPAARSEPPPESLATRPPGIPLVLTVEEVAHLLRVNRKTVYQAATRGEIPGLRRIGHAEVLRTGSAQWLETGGGQDRRRPRR
jgi:excisionase family DNA binding protein